MLAPTYVSENSPRAIRGFLVGFFQLLLVIGGMVAYFINYGSLLHIQVRSDNLCTKHAIQSVLKVSKVILMANSLPREKQAGWCP